VFFTRQYNPEDSSEHHTRRRENLKSHGHVYVYVTVFVVNMEVSIYALIPLCKVPYNCIKLELKKSLQV
jgi:hypothetical protein